MDLGLDGAVVGCRTRAVLGCSTGALDGGSPERGELCRWKGHPEKCREPGGLGVEVGGELFVEKNGGAIAEYVHQTN